MANATASASGLHQIPARIAPAAHSQMKRLAAAKGQTIAEAYREAVDLFLARPANARVLADRAPVAA